MTEKSSQLAAFRNSNKIPSPPQVAIKILELDRDPESGIQEFIAIAESDPAISAQILKYANSPMAGLSREVANLKQAVALIGLRSSRLIALSFSLMKTKSQENNFEIGTYWQECVGIAVACRRLAMIQQMEADTLFVTGLLSKLGWLIVRCADPDRFDSIHAGVESDQELQQNSREQYGNTLYEIGADSLQHWGFPKVIYGPVSQISSVQESDEPNVRVLGLGLKISELLSETGLDVCVNSCRESYEALAGGASGQDVGFDDLFAVIQKDYIEYLKLLKIEVPELKELWELEAQARDAMTTISLQTQKEWQQLEVENKRLSSCALTDPLTGLGNRRAFEEKVSEEVDRARRNNRELALLVVDIDKFKLFNDTHGHLAGDAVLAEVANCIDRGLRKYDYVYRYGGEEFVIVVPEANFEDVIHIGERVRAAVERLIVVFEGKQLNATISLGCAHADGRTHFEWNELFELADQQLYRAKKNGRNQVCSSKYPQPNFPETTANTPNPDASCPV